MNPQAWKTLGSCSPNDLVDASLELHWAVQLVAAAGQTFAEKRDDDSHRAMTWDTTHKAFVGAPFAGPYPFRVGLRPEDLTLLLLDRTEEALGALPLPGKSIEEGYEWLRVGLATYMGGAPALIERPEYDMPEHPVGVGARFSTRYGDELSALSALFATASSLLEELISTRPDASPVRCWPHHFDLATLLTVETDDDGKASKTVGVGLAPTGGGYDAWYWYVTPWPYPEIEALPELSGPGAWHTEGWTGAVLPGDLVVAAEDASREAVVRNFLDVSVDAVIASLKG